MTLTDNQTHTCIIWKAWSQTMWNQEFNLHSCGYGHYRWSRQIYEICCKHI